MDAGSMNPREGRGPAGRKTGDDDDETTEEGGREAAPLARRPTAGDAGRFYEGNPKASTSVYRWVREET